MVQVILTKTSSVFLLLLLQGLQGKAGEKGSKGEVVSITEKEKGFNKFNRT